MSLDLEVWSANPLARDATPPGEVAWTRQRSGWSHSGGGWQIVFEDSVEIDEEDVPSEAASTVAGIRFLTRLTLEPISAPQNAVRLLRRVAREFSRRSFGVVYNPQQDSYSPFRRSKALPAPPPGEPTDLMSMSWWFPTGPLTTRDGARRLLTYFSQNVPQALPRRYVFFEPPEHRFDPATPDHFLDLLFAREAWFGFVWQCAGPFSLHYSTVGPAWNWRPGLGDHAFSVPSLVWNVPTTVLNEPGWETELRRCWRAITLLARPMYADVRVLRGYLVKRGSIYGLPRAESHPVRAGWRGLPTKFGLAVALGAPFLDHWPAMKALSADGATVMQSVPSWRDGGEVSRIAGLPPDALCMPEYSGLADYWRFEPKPVAKE